MTLAEALKRRIAELCAENNFTVNKLCTLSGLTHSTIASFLSSKTKVPKIDTIYYISLGFGLSLSEFFDSPLFDNIDDN